MINLVVALGLDIADKLLGTSAQTERMLAESARMNREEKRMIMNVASSTNAIWEQSAITSYLLAESMKNDNLRRFKEIEKERWQILNS